MGVDEVPGGMRDEGVTSSHLVVKGTQMIVVSLDGEVWDPPHALAQDPDDGSDVEELHTAPSGQQRFHREASCTGGCSLALGVAAHPSLRGKGAKEVLDQLEGGFRPDVLGEVATAWP